MKFSFKSLLLSTALLLTMSQAFGQLIAGEVPAGASISISPVELILVVRGDTSAAIDLDADGSDDIGIGLVKADHLIHGGNIALLLAPLHAYSFCVWTGDPKCTIYNCPTLYNSGDTLCATGQEWGMDSVYIVGCHGTWGCHQSISSVQDKFIAYRNNSTGDIGWMKVSMTLYSQGDLIPVTFTISEFLLLDSASDIYEPSISQYFDIVPNPTYDGKFSILNADDLVNLEIFTSSGQRIATYYGAKDEYVLPDIQGLYIVRVSDERGAFVFGKILRL